MSYPFYIYFMLIWYLHSCLLHFPSDIANTNYTYDIKIHMTWKNKRIWHEKKNVYDIEKKMHMTSSLAQKAQPYFQAKTWEIRSCCAQNINFMFNAPAVVSENSFKKNGFWKNNFSHLMRTCRLLITAVFVSIVVIYHNNKITYDNKNSS